MGRGVPSSVRKLIQRLRLEPGDILVVRDWEIVSQLVETPISGVPQIPIIYAPNGIEKMKREDLQAILDKQEEHGI